jgi:hypothetical protein
MIYTIDPKQAREMLGYLHGHLREEICLKALEAIADGAVMPPGREYTHVETVLAYQRLAREALTWLEKLG